jgi:hypothetical protein
VTRSERARLAKERLLSLAEIPGWVLYGFGIVEIAAGWPWSRWVGVIAIILGLFDHARGVDRAWRGASAPPA